MLLDAFLKFEEPALVGESTDGDHSSEIEILSFEQSILRAAPSTGAKSGGSDTGKATSEHQPLTVVKLLDKASPKLYQAASAGTVYGKATLSICQPSGTTTTTSDQWKKVVVLQIVLNNVYISRVHLVGDPALHTFGRSKTFPITDGALLNMGPLEEIDLSYKKIDWLYKGGTGTQNINGKWNLLTNSAS